MTFRATTDEEGEAIEDLVCDLAETILESGASASVAISAMLSMITARVANDHEGNPNGYERTMANIIMALAAYTAMHLPRSPDVN